LYPGFFRIFSFPFIQGDPETALNDPFTMVLTESYVHKYFGNNNPVGQTVEFMGRPFIIKGVMADTPSNSHLQFDFLLSPLGLENMQNYEDDWVSDVVFTYVQVRTDSDIEALNRKMTEFIKPKHRLWEKIEARFYLQPLSDIHLNSGLSRENIVHGDRKYIFIFSIIALGLLLIACTNFMNLSTARAAVRTKEIGIRKVMGASIGEVVVLLSRQFAKWIIVANLIAWPVAYLAMKNWLFNFAYRTDIPLWIFPVTGILTLLVALLTVSFQSVKAALANPIKALRYE